ncbi:MAG: acetate--CoA ligase [Gammaproteobacteria bacterium]|nr:acetate--CoA ligase [Gammaproteobacteria bacterium]
MEQPTKNTIDSILQENRSFSPPEKFVENASISNPRNLEVLYQTANDDHEAFWAKLACNEIDWQTRFSKILDDSDAPYYRWFDGGRLNVSYNCIDRHLIDRADKTAILFEGERGDKQTLTYRELHSAVCRFANALKLHGIKHGDRVVLYMPMVPEAVIAMQACARIGAIHSVVFGGFSAEALKNRIEDAGAKAVITADGGYRGGKITPLKVACDEALSLGCRSVETVFVLKRTEAAIAMVSGRDVYWHEVTKSISNDCPPEWVDSEHPLFLLYTSGSTGKPKGIQHSSAGYLLGTIMTMKWVFDAQDNDIYWCTADVGWVTGHSYVAYGPLALGMTLFMYEGAPTVPDAGRLWKLCQDHKITVFYTAPTAIRTLMKAGDDFPNRYDLSSLRLLGSVGEPINPEAWMWYHRVIGKERCPVVDTWWQTETGAIVIAPIPGIVATKPGSCTRPLPGMDVAIVDEKGNEITEPDQGGYLVIRKPWPSMLRTIWGDDQRYRETYWQRFNHQYYVAGDSARRDKDGYYWIMGRIDDVLNVSGHRLGSMEIESALVAHELVIEAAVVGRPDELTGEAIVAYVVLKGQRPEGGVDNKLSAELQQWVSKQIGAIAKPKEIRYADNLPKTRSGKIMRRLLRAIACGEAITQDTSTLENEAVLEQLQGKQ